MPRRTSIRLEHFAARHPLRTLTQRHRIIAVAIAVALSAVAFERFFDGLKSAEAETFTYSLICGGVAGALALLVIAALINGWTTTTTRSRRTMIGVAMLCVGLAATAISVTWFETHRWSLYVSPIALCIAMVGLLFVKDIAADGAARRSGQILTSSLIATAVALAIAGSIEPDATGWTGLVAMGVLGLMGVKLSITPWMTNDATSEGARRRRQWFTLLLAIGGTVAAVLVLSGADQPRSLTIGSWLLVLSLSTGGLAALVVDLGGARLPILAVVAVLGIAMSSAGITRLVNLIPAWESVAWLAFIIASLVGAFFVFEGEGVVALVLLGALLGWALVDRDASPVVADDPSGTIVALGDSFMSGQGATNFVEHTNSGADGANMCRRSPRSFAYLVAAEFNKVLANYSCSGATSEDVIGGTTVQTPDTRRASDGHRQLQDLAGGPFAVDNRDDVDLVLVSLGGNGAEFSTAVFACFLPSNCTDKRHEFLHLAAAVEADLLTTYRKIREVFGDDPPEIIVIPYPSYIGVEACDSALDLDEVAFANTFIDTLNSAIWTATEAAGDGVLYFDDIDEAYAGHTVCDAQPGANFINLHPPSGPILQRLVPTDWHQGSAHPNELGHACTAAVLADWIVERGLLPAGDRAGIDLGCERDRVTATDRDQHIAEPVDGVPAKRSDEDWSATLADSARCCDWREHTTVFDGDCRPDQTCSTADAWVGVRSRAFIGDLIRPIGLAAFGAMLLALCFVRVVQTTWLRYLPLIPPQARCTR